MIESSEIWSHLFGFGGLLNPYAIIVGASLGWFADSLKKIPVAGFAATFASLVLDSIFRLTGLDMLTSVELGALAVFPFRFVASSIAALLLFAVRRKLNNNPEK